MFHAFEVNCGAMWMACRIGSLHDPFGASVAGLCTVMSLRNEKPVPVT